MPDSVTSVAAPPAIEPSRLRWRMSECERMIAELQGIAEEAGDRDSGATNHIRHVARKAGRILEALKRELELIEFDLTHDPEKRL